MRHEPVFLGDKRRIETDYGPMSHSRGSERHCSSERTVYRDRSLQQHIKRSMDVSISLLIIVVALPVMCMIAIVIVLESGRPVIFQQERQGRNGKIFKIYKFRTMKAHAADGRQVTRRDPRVTCVGRFLRRSSLDELPQIFNVLLGQMSLVGPRPHPLWLDKKYSRRVGNYVTRLEVRPGITGLAQVKGARGEIRSLSDMRRRVAWDRQYIEQWSLLLDFEVLILTAVCMWFDDSAY